MNTKIKVSYTMDSFKHDIKYYSCLFSGLFTTPIHKYKIKKYLKNKAEKEAYAEVMAIIRNNIENMQESDFYEYRLNK